MTPITFKEKELIAKCIIDVAEHFAEHLLNEATPDGWCEDHYRRKPLSKTEKQIVAMFLEVMDEHCGAHICNDTEPKFWDGWTKEERQQFRKEYEDYNGSPQDYDPNHLELPDFAVFGFLAHKLKADADATPIRSIDKYEEEILKPKENP